MTSREDLIEEAAKALYMSQWHDGDYERTSEFNKDAWRSHARAAFAVFEKAQAPTDDEREALSEFLFSVYEHGTQPNALREADAILSFLHTLRRTETPKPQTERGTAEALGFREAYREPQGEPSDAPTVQFMARKGGKTQGMIDQMLAQANERGIRVEVVNQVIPRYAMLDVWMALYDHDTSQAFDTFYEGAGYAEAWATLLAAIRARSGESQGEPSDAEVLAALGALMTDVNWYAEAIKAANPTWIKNMRAALRAAAAVREGQ